MSFDSAMRVSASMPVKTSAIVHPSSTLKQLLPHNGESGEDAPARVKSAAAEQARPAQDDPEVTPASDPQAERQLRRKVVNLSSRDREVRAHEQAHASVGGAYAGAASYSFTRGPDGKSYATGGEVGIDLSAIAGNPQATLNKMEVVRRAALAPAEPSSQDLRVAAQAQVIAAQARVELAALLREERVQASDERQTGGFDQSKAGDSSPVQQSATQASSLDLYRQSSGLQLPASVVDLLA